MPADVGFCHGEDVDSLGVDKSNDLLILGVCRGLRKSAKVLECDA
jgi:hypothetical protein